MLLDFILPAVKLHKDASGYVATAATVTADCVTDTAAALPTVVASPQQSDSRDPLTRLAKLEKQVVDVHSELAATKSSFTAALKAQEQNSIAREIAIKDSGRHQVSQLEGNVEYLSQCQKIMAMHGVP